MADSKFKKESWEDPSSQRAISGNSPMAFLFAALHKRQFLRHFLVHLVELGDGDRKMDEDEQDEKHADEEQEGGRVVDPCRVRGPFQPIPLQGEHEHDHAACQPEDRILLPEFPSADHFEDIEEK